MAGFKVITEENRCYGSRRVIIELQKLGLLVDRKRVMRLMRADNLLCLRKRRFVCTTDSRHTYAVYPNLTLDWKPNGINQLWVADRPTSGWGIIPLPAVILDAYSRRVIGWGLGIHWKPNSLLQLCEALWRIDRHLHY